MAEQATKGAGGDKKQYAAAYGQIVAKAWADDKFRQALLKDPGGVLRANGFALADYLEVKVADGESGAPTLNFPLPPKPRNVDAQSIQEFLRTADGCCCC